MRILQTTAYHKFKDLLGNRVLDEQHIQALIQSIREENLLSVYPILINEKWEIIDGQHRLEAARRLGTPIFYIVGRGLDITHARKMNILKKEWRLDDYLSSYTDLGIDTYEEYSEIRQETSFSHKILIGLSKRPFREAKSLFKRGLFKIDNKAEIMRVHHLITEIEPYFAKARSTSFVLACKELLRRGIDTRSIVKTIEQDGLEERPAMENYLQDLLEVAQWNQ